MSKYEQKENSGSLFKVENKTNERGPDYSGTCNIDGVEFFMDAWLKTADSGRRWMSFSFKQKNKQPQPAAQPQRTHSQMKRGEPAPKSGAGFDNVDDDIPW